MILWICRKLQKACKKYITFFLKGTAQVMGEITIDSAGSADQGEQGP